MWRTGLPRRRACPPLFLYIKRHLSFLLKHYQLADYIIQHDYDDLRDELDNHCVEAEPCNKDRNYQLFHKKREQPAAKETDKLLEKFA